MKAHHSYKIEPILCALSIERVSSAKVFLMFHAQTFVKVCATNVQRKENVRRVEDNYRDGQQPI